MALRLGLQADDKTGGDILTYKSRLTHPPPPKCTAATEMHTWKPLRYLQCIHTHIIERELYSTESQHSESRQRGSRVQLTWRTSRGPAWRSRTLRS